MEVCQWSFFCILNFLCWKLAVLFTHRVHAGGDQDCINSECCSKKLFLVEFCSIFIDCMLWAKECGRSWVYKDEYDTVLCALEELLG